MTSIDTQAELALLLEVAATPTPGNVDRTRDLPELSFEQFLGGAAGARTGLTMAADDAPVGAAFERAIAGMADTAGTNTQFGALLLSVPLVKAATRGELTGAGATGIVQSAGVEGAVGFYRAFDHVDVRVAAPPPDIPDVQRGSDAVPTIRDRELSLVDVLAPAVDRDGVAAELLNEFEWTFRAADHLRSISHLPLLEQGVRTHLWLLAQRPDTLVVLAHDMTTAREVQQRAATVCPASPDDSFDWERAEAFAEDLVTNGINPGTTADLLAGALFIGLQRGEITIA